MLPSSVEARHWDSSLDKLLQSSYGTALFRAFLQKEYAEENLDFVLRVERYRESLPKKRERDAWKIYRTYIVTGAPHELNLDILSRKVSVSFHCM
jgi:regulator of G-protein signaling 3/regulator of G-protein signaling